MKARIVGSVLAALLLAGCSVTPPPEEIFRQLAANAAGRPITQVVPATPEDAAAIQQAATEIDEHVRQQRQAVSTPSVSVKTDYEVAVMAPRSMAGTWRMINPTQITVHSGEKDQYGRVHSFLCRIDQTGEALRGSCLPTRANLSGKIHQGEVRLSWGSGLVSAEIKGMLLTPTDFAGVLSLGAMGMSLVGTDIPAYASKVPASVPAPFEVEALAARITHDLAASDFSSDLYTPEARAALASDPPLSSSDLRALGAVRERLHLGSIEGQDEKPENMEVYDVEFERGWKLCGFTRNGDGSVDHIECR